MEEKKVGIIKRNIDFFRLLFNSDIPWLRVLIGFLFSSYIGMVQGAITVKFAEILAAKLESLAPIWEYLYFSLALTAIVLAMTAFTKMNLNLISKKMRKESFCKLITLDSAELDRIGTSKLITRIMSDSVSVGFTVTTFSSAITYFSFFWTQYQFLDGVNPTLPILIIPSVLFTTLMVLTVGKLVSKWAKKAKLAESLFVGYMSEKLADVKFIKARATEDHEIEESRVQVQKYFIAMWKQIMASIWLKSIFNSLQPVIFSAVIYIIGSGLVKTGELTLAELIAFSAIGTGITGYLQKAGNELLSIRITQTSAGVIIDLYSRESEQMERERGLEVPVADIEFKDVSFNYNSDKPILENVSFTIPKGKTTAIVGPSGGGKTTILKLIERLYTPHAGEITYDGVDVEKINLREWRKSFGFIVQNSPLLTGTIRDNINYSLEPGEEGLGMEQVCKVANVDAFIDKIDGGLDSEVGELGSKLSGGQRQRVTIARALMKNTNYLLLDEATANLDKASENTIVDSINNHMSTPDKTLIVVAHNFSTIQKADKIIVMSKGTVDAQGTHDELYKSSEVYKELVDLQNN